MEIRKERGQSHRFYKSRIVAFSCIFDVRLAEEDTAKRNQIFCADGRRTVYIRCETRSRLTKIFTTFVSFQRYVRIYVTFADAASQGRTS